MNVLLAGREQEWFFQKCVRSATTFWEQTVGGQGALTISGGHIRESSGAAHGRRGDDTGPGLRNAPGAGGEALSAVCGQRDGGAKPRRPGGGADGAGGRR